MAACIRRTVHHRHYLGLLTLQAGLSEATWDIFRTVERLSGPEAFELRVLELADIRAAIGVRQRPLSVTATTLGACFPRCRRREWHFGKDRQTLLMR